MELVHPQLCHFNVIILQLYALPVTQAMVERAMKPLTAEMKQWMQEMNSEQQTCTVTKKQMEKYTSNSPRNTLQDARAGTRRLEDTVKGQVKEVSANRISQIDKGM